MLKISLEKIDSNMSVDALPSFLLQLLELLL